MNPVVKEKRDAKKRDTDQVSLILKRFEKLKEVKRPWLKDMEAVSEFVDNRKQSFESLSEPGEFCTGQIFDNTAPDAQAALVASMVAALWSSGGSTVEMIPSRWLSESARSSEAVKKQFKRMNLELHSALDAFDGGLDTSLEESTDDETNYGIGGVTCYVNPDEHDRIETPIIFESVNAKKTFISQDSRGKVNTVYIVQEYTVMQLIELYGNDAEESRKKEWANGDLDKTVKVLHAIEPRMDVLHGEGSRNMPWASVHIDLDKRYKMKESGYPRMPAFICRFWKKPDETYGRCPSMRALADIFEINTFRESTIIGTEKLLDPPVMVREDGIAGGGDVDTSAGATNVYHDSGRIENNRPAIEPINLVGEMNTTFKRIDTLEVNIQNKYYSDKLNDLGSNQRMTQLEVAIRNILRLKGLARVYKRQRSEKYIPLINYVISLLLELGRFGYGENTNEYAKLKADAILNGTEAPEPMPEEVWKLFSNGDAYDLKFSAEAERVIESEKLEGIRKVLGAAIELAPVAPDILDNFDWDEIVVVIGELGGAPSRIFNSTEKRQAIRDSKAQQQAAMQQKADGQAQAETFKTMAQGARDATKSGIPLQSLLPTG